MAKSKKQLMGHFSLQETQYGMIRFTIVFIIMTYEMEFSIDAKLMLLPYALFE